MPIIKRFLSSLDVKNDVQNIDKIFKFNNPIQDRIRHNIYALPVKKNCNKKIVFYCSPSLHLIDES